MGADRVNRIGWPGPNWTLLFELEFGKFFLIDASMFQALRSMIG